MELNGYDDLLGDDFLSEVPSQEVQEEPTKFEDPTDEPVEEPEVVEEPAEPVEHTGIEEFLIAKGIKDPSKIQFSNEDGEIETRAFNDLSAEEQKMILDELSAQSEYTEEESQVIDFLRDNRMTFGQALEQYAKDKIEEYKASITKDQPTTYEVDAFSDEELYLGDLQNKFPEYTKDQLLKRLEKAKEDEDAFKEDVDALRAQYKAYEEQEKAASEQREQKEYEDLKNTLTQAIDSFNEFALDYADPESDTLVLEDEDKIQMLSYLLEQDSTGKSQIAKDLENPEALAQIALLRIKGAEFLAQSTRYYKQELAKVHAENKKLKAQLEKAPTSTNNSSKSSVVEKKPTKDTSIRINYFDRLI